jgi:hypothetical protein
MERTLQVEDRMHLPTRVMGHVSWATCHGPRVMGHVPWATCHGLSGSVRFRRLTPKPTGRRISPGVPRSLAANQGGEAFVKKPFITRIDTVYVKFCEAERLILQLVVFMDAWE